MSSTALSLQAVASDPFQDLYVTLHPMGQDFLDDPNSALFLQVINEPFDILFGRDLIGNGDAGGRLGR